MTTETITLDDTDRPRCSCGKLAVPTGDVTAGGAYLYVCPDRDSAPRWIGV